jgi:hypothetical protein
VDAILIALCLIVTTLSLAVVSNVLRRNCHFSGELIPNCLITRHPLLFITGPRSIFYFSSYWNFYTSFLAEHGYEVYTLHLPWRSQLKRKSRLKKFFAEQELNGKSYHLFIDQITDNEFQDYFKQLKSSAIQSISSVCDRGYEVFQLKNTSLLYPLPYLKKELHFEIARPKSRLLELSFLLHRSFFGKAQFLSLSSLGAESPQLIKNCQELLRVSKELAELDLVSD